MNATPRRWSAWKITAWAGAGFILLLLTGFLWIRWVAARRFAQMEVRVRALHQETLARNVPRRVLRGDPVPGNAWEDYQKAIAEIDQLSKDDRKLVNAFYDQRGEADRGKVAALIEARMAAFDHLRRGTRRAIGAYPSRWEEGVAMDIPKLFQSQTLANFAACRARFLAEEGKPREAAEQLLNVAQFSHDFRENAILISESIGESILFIAINGLRELVLEGRLSRADLESLERPLEILDEDSPAVGVTLLNEALTLGFECLRPEKDRDLTFRPKLWQAWRAAFSQTILEADAFDTFLETLKAAAEAERKPWLDASAFFEAQRITLVEKEKNPIVRTGLPGSSHANQRSRERVAQTRLLRAALRYKASGDVLELQDPFGGKLLHTLKEGRLRIWSVGADGIDHGGDDGGWLKWTRPISPGPGKPVPIVRDIVLEVPR